jgi:hypothetical protein
MVNTKELSEEVQVLKLKVEEQKEYTEALKEYVDVLQKRITATQNHFLRMREEFDEHLSNKRRRDYL